MQDLDELNCDIVCATTTTTMDDATTALRRLKQHDQFIVLGLRRCTPLIDVSGLLPEPTQASTWEKMFKEFAQSDERLPSLLTIDFSSWKDCISKALDFLTWMELISCVGLGSEELVHA